MTTKYGMFLEHQYLRPDPPQEGEEGTKRSAEEAGPADREHGLNFKATTGRTGKLNDATFDKFKSLYEGNKFQDQQKLQLQTMAESRKKNTVDVAFKAASPMKKSVGLGGYYGTLGGKVPYEPGTVEVRKKKGEVEEKPRGIYTSPAKKGTFGYNKTTLSERQGYKGVATEYEYQHDPETLLAQKRREEHEAHKKACASDLPFKPANPPKRGGPGVPNTTISKGKGVVGEWEYVIKEPAEEAPKKEGDGKVETPFRPSFTHASDRINHIQYIHDPEVPKMEAERKKKRDEIARLAATGPWRPTISYKTDMIRSVVKMNIGR